MFVTPISAHGEANRWDAGPRDEPCDEELVATARRDPRAFSPLYQRYLNPVYRYCYIRLGSREAAEDATSEVFLKALAGLGRYQGGSFAAWLFRIARNVTIDLHRRRRPTDGLDALEPRDPDLTPEEAVILRDEAAALRSAMAALPEDQRTVLELQLAGWSGERIASAMDRSVGAVKMLRHRAVSGLRGLLAPGERGSRGGAR